jgi:leucyl/phenylalanyl-tRNA--protein transferase
MPGQTVLAVAPDQARESFAGSTRLPPAFYDGAKKDEGAVVDTSVGGGRPIEPPAPTFAFPAADAADERGRVFVGGDLRPGTVVAAYRSGLFPMRQGNGELAWWSPDPRAVIFLDRLRVSHSLRRAIHRFEIRIDTAFGAVVEACADRAEDEYRWITDEIQEAYGTLHRLGWAHSVEAWTGEAETGSSRLVGGLYGVAVGGLFSGESMFHRERDASKAALVALVAALRGDGRDAADRMIDVQWLTPHMASLGAVEIPRAEYLARLSRALSLPLPAAFRRAATDTAS